MLLLFVLFSIVLTVNGHAVLRNPVPFNPQPTTQQPCGVTTISDQMKSTAQATWRAGEPVTILWNLVASDGGGNLNAEFDPLGGTSFTVPAWSTTFPTSGSNKLYNRTFIVPSDLDCSQSPTGLCTMRVYSPSWTSCTMVKVCSTDCVAPSPAPTQCIPVTTPLSFCGNTSGAMLSDGFSPRDIDNELAPSYQYNLASSLVFTTPDNPGCDSLYKNLLCSLSLPPCNPQTGLIDASTRACKSQCQKAMQACSVTQMHEFLYDCNDLPDCLEESNGSGGSKGMSPGGAAALSIFIIALVATLAAFGYIYYKKGSLFGYAYDKDTHKIAKVPANPHNYTAYVDSDYKM